MSLDFRLNSAACYAADDDIKQILTGAALNKQQCYVTYLGFWWEQGPGEAVHVAQVHLDAGVGEAQLVEAGGVVTGTDVTLTAKRRDGDGVLQLRLRQVVADPAVHVTLKRRGNDGFKLSLRSCCSYNIVFFISREESVKNI